MREAVAHRGGQHHLDLPLQTAHAQLHARQMLVIESLRVAWLPCTALAVQFLDPWGELVAVLLLVRRNPCGDIDRLVPTLPSHGLVDRVQTLEGSEYNDLALRVRHKHRLDIHHIAEQGLALKLAGRVVGLLRVIQDCLGTATALDAAAHRHGRETCGVLGGRWPDIP